MCETSDKKQRRSNDRKITKGASVGPAKDSVRWGERCTDRKVKWLNSVVLLLDRVQKLKMYVYNIYETLGQDTVK